MNEQRCGYDPRVMTGKPIGMFHCPECGEMVLAGLEHPRYDIGFDPDRAQSDETIGLDQT